MAGRVKSAAIVAMLIVLGLGVARAGLARTRAEQLAAPAYPAAGGGRQGYDVLALVVVAVVAVVAISMYWRHRARELLGTEADLSGFKRRRGFALRDLWECPLCQQLMRLDAVAAHQDANYSWCAFFDAWLTEHEGTTIREFVRSFTPNWGSSSGDSMSGGDDNGGVRISATMAPEESVIGGGYDTLNPGISDQGAPEIEE